VRRRVGSAVLVAFCTFCCYRATLLPGQDLGDTASFQAAVGSWTLTPRQAYPLYYALGNLFAWADPANPARALNLASAVYGALACGLLTWVAAGLVDSTAAGLFGGLLLGFSYTFWSQAIIAEVYTLHLLLLLMCLAALLWWRRAPSLTRLAVFFSVCALGFGNHLSMVLMLPAFSLFLLFGTRQGPRLVLQPAVVLLAILFAALGSLQYAWNFRGAWSAEIQPAGLLDALRTLWFDATKQDWRESLVLGVDRASLLNRASMYWFDVRQQFGVAGTVLAGLGAISGLWKRTADTLLLLIAYLANLLFALTYNVGDTHVFFLPSHLMVAILAAAGAAVVMRTAGRVPVRGSPAAAGVLCLALVAHRGWDTWPAVDRSDDTRPKAYLDELTSAVTSPDALFGMDMNWQLDNALDYYAKCDRPDLAWFRADEVLSHFPALLEDNAAIGRTVLATARTADLVMRAYPGAFRAELDPRLAIASLTETVRQVPRGTPYVLAYLQANREVSVDESDLSGAIAYLTAGAARQGPDRRYQTLAGVVGSPPAAAVARDGPYRVSADLAGLAVQVRMESWLPADTIRRAGFGHVLAGRRHVLTLERGISFVALDRGGRPLLTAYRAGLLAPQPRYAIRARR
jgi:hypothetical protein